MNTRFQISRNRPASAPSTKAVLSVASTARPHAVLAIWDAGWVPRCWYVNLQAPLRRTAIGFDTTDLFLDLVGTPDGSRWTWKDEDEAEQAVTEGLLDDAALARIRGEAQALAAQAVVHHGQAVFARHHYVHDHQVGRRRLDRAQGFVTRGGLPAFRVQRFERHPDQFAQLRVIVDDEYVLGCHEG